MIGFLSTIAIAAAIILLLGFAVRPRYLRVKFDPKTTPVFSWVNRPKSHWSDSYRTVSFPTGDSYVIPPNVRGHFVMIFDWVVAVNVDGRAGALNIPKLLPTDFASIPRMLHSLLSPLNNTVYAAIVHDYLYRNPSDAFAKQITRAEADRIFYWAMRVKDVWRVTAGLMYLGVRIGGTDNYRRYARPTPLKPYV